jgi:hypothetical protein
LMLLDSSIRFVLLFFCCSIILLIDSLFFMASLMLQPKALMISSADVQAILPFYFIFTSSLNLLSLSSRP